MSNPVQHYSDVQQAMLDSLPGQAHDWLQAKREDAMQAFQQVGFPHSKLEAWRYTDTRPIAKHSYQPTAKACLGLAPEDLDRYIAIDEKCHRLVFVNGHYAAELSTNQHLPEGFSLTHLADNLGQSDDWTKQHVGHYVDPAHDAFVALNQAFLVDGACIQISENSIVEQPIHLIYLNTQQQQEVFSQPRNIVVLETGAQAKLIESHVSIGESAHFSNSVTEIKLAGNAHLEHYKIQQECLSSYHLSYIHVNQHQDSQYHVNISSTGARIARHDIKCNLLESGASCYINGLYMLDKRQHCDFHSRVEHIAPHCNSDEYIKGVLNGRARAVFDGLVHVLPQAQLSDAKQSNKNLILSEHAEVDTRPQLAIFADDVKCAHGITIGRLDKQMLFYLQSRGISAKNAETMLISGFVDDVISRMKLASVRDSISQHCQTLLEKTNHVS